MKKNIESNKLRKMSTVIREEQHSDSRIRREIRNYLRSASEATAPDVFYFSMNGMVMPLSRRA